MRQQRREESGEGWSVADWFMMMTIYDDYEMKYDDDDDEYDREIEYDDDDDNYEIKYDDDDNDGGDFR